MENLVAHAEAHITATGQGWPRAWRPVLFKTWSRILSKTQIRSLRLKGQHAVLEIILFKHVLHVLWCVYCLYVLFMYSQHLQFSTYCVFISSTFFKVGSYQWHIGVYISGVYMGISPVV